MLDKLLLRNEIRKNEEKDSFKTADKWTKLITLLWKASEDDYVWNNQQKDQGNQK